MEAVAEQKIRVLVAKPGLDGHDRGAKVIARALRDAGMEVIYTGLRQTPEMIVNAALQEDVHVIGLSILSGAHNAIVPRVMELLKQNKMDDVLIVLGGIIPNQDVDSLKKARRRSHFPTGYRDGRYRPIHPRQRQTSRRSYGYLMAEISTSRLKELLQRTVGPTPWYWKTFPAFNGASGQRFVWTHHGDQGPLAYLVSLSLEQEPEKPRLALNTYCRPFFVPPSHLGFGALKAGAFVSSVSIPTSSRLLTSRKLPDGSSNPANAFMPRRNLSRILKSSSE